MTELSGIPPEPTRNPATKAAFRRQVWLQIYLPLLAGVVLLALIAALLWRSGTAGTSAWADASLILLLLPIVILSIIPIVLLSALVYGVSYLMRQIPIPAHQAQQALAQLRRIAERTTRKSIQPLIVLKAVGAAAGTGADSVKRMLRRMGNR
ncbi:MAG: hypothetical protein ACLFWD_04560 [Anaerolineales bacterium]